MKGREARQSGGQGTTWDLWKAEKRRGERGKERGEMKQVQEKGLRTLEQEESGRAAFRGVTRTRRTRLRSSEGCHWHQPGCGSPLARGNGAAGPTHGLLAMKVILLLFFNWVWSHSGKSDE